MRTSIRFMFTIAITLTMMAVEATGQLGPRPDPQIRRRQGINRPLRPRAGLNPNQLRRQQLQQRVMQALGLTPEQRMRMQEIRRSHEDEVIAAGRRLRQARQALDRAIMSEPFNEAEVRDATEALAAAQADKIRIDARVRAGVRRVLRPDQVLRFHQLQREMRREMREQQDIERENGPRGTTAPLGFGELDLIGLLPPLP